MTAASPASNGEEIAPRPPAVDRNWLVKLLRQHAKSEGEVPSDLRDKALVVAPMVDQSDLPFRLLCRQHGSNLAYTPMIHARLFCEKPIYRKKFFDLTNGTPPEDRPLIAQFCGSDSARVLEAATHIQPFVDAIDINCGCPQGIAKRGRYGAFLLEQPDTLVSLVQTLASRLSIPVTVKVRLLPSGVDDSLQLYQRLVDAGAAMITIHGRNRFQKGPDTGAADWDAIRRAVDLLGCRVPILANGSISSLDDVRECLKATGADGVMASEAILEYPPIFSSACSVEKPRTGPGRLELARHYMDLARQFPPDEGGQGSGIKCIRAHLHRFLHADLQAHTDIRDKLVSAVTVEDLQEALDDMEQLHRTTGHDVRSESLSWYMRHRICDENGVNLSQQAFGRTQTVKQTELVEDAADCMENLFDADW